MSDNKKYYWLKLNEDFFDDDTVTWLEEQENGKDYVIFYLKLCLKSLKDDGRLIRYVGEKLIPYDVKALAKLTNTKVDTVAIALKVFADIGLIERLETGEIYLTQINELIGKETESAKRMRKKRLIEQKDSNKYIASQCAHNVQKSDIEIEIEKELEIDKEIDKEKPSSGKPDPIPYAKIIDYLNNKAGRSFKNVEANKKLIRARWNEGFVFDDFKKVIDIKTNEWIKDTKMASYLRPATLFGNKFDQYLNQQPKEVINNRQSEYERELGF